MHWPYKIFLSMVFPRGKSLSNSSQTLYDLLIAKEPLSKCHPIKRYLGLLLLYLLAFLICSASPSFIHFLHSLKSSPSLKILERSAAFKSRSGGSYLHLEDTNNPCRMATFPTPSYPLFLAFPSIF